MASESLKFALIDFENCPLNNRVSDTLELLINKLVEQSNSEICDSSSFSKVTQQSR